MGLRRWFFGLICVVFWYVVAADDDSLGKYVVNARRELHQIPELKYEERVTSKYVRDALDDMGVTFVHSLGGGTGVVGTIGTGDEPVVVLRADMDALPIHEDNEKPYKSKHDGKYIESFGMRHFGLDGTIACVELNEKMCGSMITHL